MENNNNINYTEEEQSSSPVDDFNLGLLIFIVNKSIIWLILIIIVSVSVSVIYLRYAPRIYLASTTLMLKEEKTTQILGIKDLLKDQDHQTEVTREIQLIKSNIFVERIVNHLPLQISYYREGKTKFVAHELYTSSPFQIEGNIIDVDIINVPVYVRIKNPRKVYIEFSIAGKESEYTIDTGSVFSTPYFSLTVHLKGNLLPEDISGLYYFKFLDKNDLIDDVSDKIEVLPIDPSTKTIAIQYKDRNPNRARDIMATVATEFIKFDIERKKEGINNILKFIDSEIDTFATFSDRFQDSITALRIADGYVDRGDRYLGDLGTKLMDFESKFRDIDYDLSLMHTFKLLMASNKEYANLPALTFKTANVTFDNEIQRINEMQQMRNNDLLDATTHHPTVRMIDKQIEDEKNRLSKNIDNAIENLQTGKTILNEQYRKYMDALAAMPGLQSKFGRLDRMANTRNEFVMNLFTQKSNYLIASAGIVSDYVLLERAQFDPNPISPNENMAKIAGFGIGLLIGLIMIVIRYLLHNTVTSIDDVEKKTKAPLLAVIPRYKEELERSQVVVTQDPKSAITESFRALRTNLQFISNEPGPKILSTTSTIPGEGKTFVSLNIAAILTLLHKKVIILDFDMRKPRLDKIFDVESHKGISTILSGQTTVNECIMESGIPHLDFVTSGPVPPNPSELILLPRLHEVFSFLKTKYDYIIIDTPPIGLVTDALEILKHSDYPIYILRAAYSNRGFINSINRIITESKVKKLSVVVNDFGRGASGYGYGYGSGYGGYGSYGGYGYGYGYGYSKYGEGYYTSESKKKPTSWWRSILGVK